MSQERHEHRLDNPKEKVAAANDCVMNEVNSGREDLAKEHIARQSDLKAGAASGITNEFGKPTIDFDDQHTQKSSKYTSRPILPVQSEPGADVDNRGAALPEQTVGHDNAGAVMTPYSIPTGSDRSAHGSTSKHGFDDAGVPTHRDAGAIAGTDAPPDEVPRRPVHVDHVGSPASPNLDSADLTPLFQMNQSRLDRDHDGFVSRQELDQATRDPSITGADAQMVNTLSQGYRRFSQLTSDGQQGISLRDMQRFDELQNNPSIANNSEERALINGVNRSFEVTGERLQNVNHGLYGDSANPRNSISPDAVRQGSEGDCVFQADVAALAHSNPGAIQNMIRDNHNGTYTVTFPGDREHPVTVPAPTDAEMAQHGGGSEHGVWPAVLERAYVDYAHSHGRPGDSAYTPGDSREETARVMHLLTGRNGQDRDMSDVSDADMQRILANSNRQPVSVFANNERCAEIGWSDNRDDATGLQRGHAYSVTGYDPQTHQVRLRNPWGSGEPVDANGRPRDGVDDGEFTMSYEEYRRTFHRVSYAS